MQFDATFCYVYTSYYIEYKNIKDKSCVDLVAGKAGVILQSFFFYNPSKFNCFLILSAISF